MAGLRVAVLASAFFLTAAVGTAQGRPLDSEGAEGALELALDAELAGDGEGAARAIQTLLAEAEDRDEGVARSLLDDWLKAAHRRVPGLARSAGATARAETWASLEIFPAVLRAKVWARFVECEPSLSAPWPAMRVRLDRVLGVPRNAFRALLGQALERQALRQGAGPLELAVTLDATDVSSRGRWKDVRAQLEFVLTATSSRAPSRRGVARFSKARTERRRDEGRAALFAARRAAKDAATRLRFVLRQERLRDKSRRAATRPETEPAPR